MVTTTGYDAGYKVGLGIQQRKTDYKLRRGILGFCGDGRSSRAWRFGTRGCTIEARPEPEESAEGGNDDGRICSCGIPIAICSSCLIVQSVRKAVLRCDG